MTDLIVKLAKLTPNQIHNHLSEHYPQPMHESIKRDVEEFKKHRKVEKLKAYYQTNLWRDLLRNLNYELANTRVGRKYKSRHPAPERDAAFDAYIAVMEKLSTMIEHNYARTGITPTNLAKEKNVPNNGEHWTDWIPAHIKEKITTKFDGIPHTPKTKRKLPFQRMARPIRNGTAKTKREVLTETVRNELELIVRTLAVADTEKVRTRQHQLRRVLDWLENTTDSTAMPRTWHGVLRLIENGSD